MIVNFSVNPRQITKFSVYEMEIAKDNPKFPILQIDRGSYVVGSSIQSGLNFDFQEGRHCLQIGKYNGIAESITFMIDLNHDYKNVAQGSPDFLDINQKIERRIHRKGAILIQNDVWIGHGVTIMSGVTIHNGAAIAANTVVTKDVPPYAIVGGNPARILKYRFSEEQIQSLLTIAWWNWDFEKLKQRGIDFLDNVENFIQKYLPEAQQSWKNVVPFWNQKERPVILLIPDFEENYSLWQKILKQYFSQPHPEYELLIYIEPKYKKWQNKLFDLLKEYEDCDANVTIQSEKVEDIRSLFVGLDYFIVTRRPETIQWTGFADYCGAKLICGVDDPIFNIL